MASALWFCGYCGDGPFTAGIHKSCSSCGRDKGPTALDADMDAEITLSPQIFGRRHGYITTPLSSDKSDLGHEDRKTNTAVEGDLTVLPKSTPDNIAITNGILAPVEYHISSKSTLPSNTKKKLQLKLVDTTMHSNLISTSAAISLHTISGDRTLQIDEQKCRVWLRLQGNLTPCIFLFSVGTLVLVISLCIALYWALAWKDPQTGFTMMTGIVVVEIMVYLLAKLIHKDCQCFSQPAEPLGELAV